MAALWRIAAAGRAHPALAALALHPPRPRSLMGNDPEIITHFIRPRVSAGNDN
jgi:hypothetical protein